MRGTRIFSEKISTRIKVRPEFETALKLCIDIKGAEPDQAVILAVHEMKQLARNAAELMTLAGTLQGAGIQLELLTGPLTGIYDPNGMGSRQEPLARLGLPRPGRSRHVGQDQLTRPVDDPSGSYLVTYLPRRGQRTRRCW